VRIALTLVIGSLLLLALIWLSIPKLLTLPRKKSTKCYVCSRCGIHKFVENQRVGPISYSTLTTYSTDYSGPKVSDVLGSDGGAHVWLQYFSRPDNSRPFAPGMPGGDRVNYSINALDWDRNFHAELAGMTNRQEIWNPFVTALVSNAAFEKAFLNWRYFSHNTNASISAWVATNGYWSPHANRPRAPAQ
jgi:hypothetical protein